MEHHSNIVPWHFLRERKGVVLKFIPVSDDGSFDIEAFEAAAVAADEDGRRHPHVERAGHDQPGREITEMAHARGVLVLVDGCQGAVHLQVDVQALGRRLLRLHRPQALRPDRHRRALRQGRAAGALPPYQGGGEMIDTVTLDQITYAEPPHRFEAGTPPILEAIGLGAAID